MLCEAVKSYLANAKGVPFSSMRLAMKTTIKY